MREKTPRRVSSVAAFGVIPARYGSTRFPGKPLALIKGLTLIEHVWRRAKKSRKLDEVIVATDDRRIFEHARGFGAKAVMTSNHARSGTDRIAEVARRIGGGRKDIFINIQGDEPLISPRLIDRLVGELEKDPGLPVVTAAYPIAARHELNDPNVVKAALDPDGYALYFSRFPIPFERKKSAIAHLKHLGIYGYRRDFLLRFASMKRTPLESTEELEQLRVLENGFRIKAVISRTNSFGVDTPRDIRKIERIIA